MSEIRAAGGLGFVSLAAIRRDERVRATHREVSSADAAKPPQAAEPRHFARFAVVGGLGTLTNLVLFYLLVDGWAAVSALAGAAICFAVAVSQNYVLNERWTFRVVGTGTSAVLDLARYFKFVAASGIGFAVNAAVLVALQALYEFPLAVVPQAVGIAAGMAFNFVVSKFVVFRRDT